MPIPEIIEELYGARYDWLMAPLEEKAQRKARFEDLKERAAKEYGCTPTALWVAVRDNYHLWVKQNKLPRPPRV